MEHAHKFLLLSVLSVLIGVAGICFGAYALYDVAGERRAMERERAEQEKRTAEERAAMKASNDRLQKEFGELYKEFIRLEKRTLSQPTPRP